MYFFTSRGCLILLLSCGHRLVNPLQYFSLVRAQLIPTRARQRWTPGPAFRLVQFLAPWVYGGRTHVLMITHAILYDVLVVIDR